MAIRARLAVRDGAKKVAKAIGVGNGTVSRIRAEMAAWASRLTVPAQFEFCSGLDNGASRLPDDSTGIGRKRTGSSEVTNGIKRTFVQGCFRDCCVAHPRLAEPCSGLGRERAGKRGLL